MGIGQVVVAPGGGSANIGVHGRSVELHIEGLWAHDITLRTRLVDTRHDTDSAQDRGRGDTRSAGPRHAPLSRSTRMERASTTFGNAAKARALKVVLASD